MSNSEQDFVDATDKYVRELLAQISMLERERDEAMPVLEAAQKQYDAAGSGWIGAWWLNPAFQGAAIELHKAIEACKDE